MTYVHETAIIGSGVEIGWGTAVWDSAHIRDGVRIGAGCIIGEKAYIGPGVVVGDLVKLNTAVYLCTGVTLERGVMVSAHVVFTNDRYPRATTADLAQLRPSDADESTMSTTVREGATIGAGAIIGPGIEIGRFAMVGMGSVVTRSVSDFELVVGNPARVTGNVCRCGNPFETAADGDSPDGVLWCEECHRVYRLQSGRIVEAGAEETPSL
ncbi:MAG: DapH/DapD/GlmU-related protein [Actinomycetota bacterium]|nr:DapH/DapD/GlmU-related protein [Actinomycetota bacterium]